MTPVVVDASAGVELMAGTKTGRALRVLLPPEPVLWAPETIYIEVGAVLRRCARRTPRGGPAHRRPKAGGWAHASGARAALALTPLNLVARADPASVVGLVRISPRDFRGIGGPDATQARGCTTSETKLSCCDGAREPGSGAEPQVGAVAPRGGQAAGWRMTVWPSFSSSRTR